MSEETAEPPKKKKGWQHPEIPFAQRRLRPILVRLTEGEHAMVEYVTRTCNYRSMAETMRFCLVEKVMRLKAGQEEATKKSEDSP